MSASPPNPASSSGSPFPNPPGVTLGIGLTTPSPELAQICGNSGFDFVMIDMEHGPIDFETAYRMVTGLSGTEADAWIRVTTNDAGLIKRALDSGVRDVVVPMVTTREEAEQARQAIADGVTMLMLGFDTMFVPAMNQLYLGQLNRAIETAG